jgi:hypothetical protein
MRHLIYFCLSSIVCSGTIADFVEGLSVQYAITLFTSGKENIIMIKEKYERRKKREGTKYSKRNRYR